jgi:hypothetical protein
VDDQEIRALVKAVHRANFDTVSVFALDAVIADNKSHGLFSEKRVIEQARIIQK